MLTGPTRSLTAEDARANLAEALRFAVPVHVAATRGLDYDARRRYLPHGWQAVMGQLDAVQWCGKRAGVSARAFDTLARGLAVLAYEPGGVGLFGLHWCAEPHPGCPSPPAVPLGVLPPPVPLPPAKEWSR